MGMTGNNSVIRLRKATINDLELLQHWDQQQHVIASDPNDDWDWESELAREPGWREQLIAEVNGDPLGFMQIIDPLEEESHYWGTVEKDLRAIDIWIGEKKNLGLGYGTKMMQLALERCFKNPKVKGILIDPLATNTRAHKFYENVGFSFVEKRTFGKDVCFVYRLDREDWAP